LKCARQCTERADGYPACRAKRTADVTKSSETITLNCTKGVKPIHYGSNTRGGGGRRWPGGNDATHGRHQSHQSVRQGVRKKEEEGARRNSSLDLLAKRAHQGNEGERI